MENFKYFCFKPVKLDKCCCICGTNHTNAQPAIPRKVRKVRSSNMVLLEGRIRAVLVNASSQEYFILGLFDVKSVSNNVVEKGIDEAGPTLRVLIIIEEKVLPL